MGVDLLASHGTADGTEEKQATLLGWRGGHIDFTRPGDI